MGVPAVIVDERGAPVPGEVPFKEILAHPDRHSKAVMKDFYRSPEFCGACHKSTIPTNLTDYKWLRGFGTYDEWQASAYSNRSPAPFYQKAYTTCQDCHMTRESVDSGEYGAKNGSIASHRWPGGNTAVPFYYGFDEQLRKTIDFLKNQTLNIDIFALRPVATDKSREGAPPVGVTGGNDAPIPAAISDSLIAPLGQADFNLRPGETIQAYVVIQNKGLGHSLIPEQRDFYEAWVEFTVVDSAGREIFHSGFLKPDGSLDERAHSFTNRLVGKDGKLLSLHQIWDRRAVAFDNTILPGRSTLVRYEFTIPSAEFTTTQRDSSDFGVRSFNSDIRATKQRGASAPEERSSSLTGPLTITARVNYRHFNQEYLDYVLGSPLPAGAGHPAYPVVEMASASRIVKVGNGSANMDFRQGTVSTVPRAEEELGASAPEVEAQPTWLRWNNFGIALLDQGQYREALDAFNRVVALRPDYADAYTNIALANLYRTTYDDAKSAIDKALNVYEHNRSFGGRSFSSDISSSGMNGASAPEVVSTLNPASVPLFRALYIRALIGRNQEDGLASAIRDLEIVIKQFPQSREACRELAQDYFLNHQDSAALAMFEELQANDPDDLLTHYYLALLYRRAGEPAKAAQQAALYEQKRDDDGTGLRAFTFLRAHPEQRAESIPGHVHTDVTPKTAATSVSGSGSGSTERPNPR